MAGMADVEIDLTVAGGERGEAVLRAADRCFGDGDAHLAEGGERRLGVGAGRRGASPLAGGLDESVGDVQLPVRRLTHHMQGRRAVDPHGDVEGKARLRVLEIEDRRDRHRVVIEDHLDLAPEPPRRGRERRLDMGAGVLGGAVGGVHGDMLGAVEQRAGAVEILREVGPDRLGRGGGQGERRHECCGQERVFHISSSVMNRPKARGPSPVSISFTTCNVAASITLTVFENQFATIMRVLSCVASMPSGYSPTSRVAVTVRSSRDMTLTVSAYWLLTKARPCAKATP